MQFAQDGLKKAVKVRPGGDDMSSDETCVATAFLKQCVHAYIGPLRMSCFTESEARLTCWQLELGCACS